MSLASPPAPTQGPRISLEDNDDNYDNVYGNDFDTNRKYLTFSWWLLHRGSKDIMARVEAAVNHVFGPVNPREDITLERLSHLILDVRKQVEGATEVERKEHRWLAYLLPPRDQEDFVLAESGMDAPPSPTETRINDPIGAAAAAHVLQPPPTSTSASPTANPSLRRLLDETSDLIDSPTFTHVLTLLLNATFSHLIDHRIALEAFKLPPPSLLSDNRITDLDAKCKVAQTLAVFCRQAHVIAAGSSEPDDLAAVAAQAGSPNEYLAQIDGVKDLEGFAAVIYSSNFEFEAVDEGDGVGVVPAPVPAASASEEVVFGTVDFEGKDKTGAEEAKVEAGVGEETVPFQGAWEKALAREDGVA